MSTRWRLVYEGFRYRPRHGDVAEYTMEPNVHVWEDVLDDRVRIQCEVISMDVQLLGDAEGARRVLVTVELPDGLSAVLREALAGVKMHKPKEAAS